MRRYWLPLLSLLSFLAAGVAVLRSTPSRASGPEAVMAARSPYPASVAGAGVIEASTGNIAVGSAVAGVIREFYVNVGGEVQAGAPLFKIDDRDVQAQLHTASAEVEAATATMETRRHQRDYAADVARRNGATVSAEQLTALNDAVRESETALEVARAAVQQAETEIERRIVRAPAAGTVLQLHARVGEYTQGGDVGGAPLVLLGNTARLFVRVDIDQHDAWRVRPEAEATAFVRGNPALHASLHFEYIEPYVVPKAALTGGSTERIDTRVLQVMYSFERAGLPVYVGQQVDVFIAARPLDETAGG